MLIAGSYKKRGKLKESKGILRGTGFLLGFCLLTQIQKQKEARDMAALSSLLDDLPSAAPCETRSARDDKTARRHNAKSCKKHENRLGRCLCLAFVPMSTQIYFTKQM